MRTLHCLTVVFSIRYYKEYSFFFLLHDLIQYESVSSNCSNVRGSKKENLYIIQIYIDLVYCNSHLSSILLQTQIKIHTDLTREDHLGAGRPELKDTIEMYGTVLALSTATNLSPWRERTPKTIADRTLPKKIFLSCTTPPPLYRK